MHDQAVFQLLEADAGSQQGVDEIVNVSTINTGCEPAFLLTPKRERRWSSCKSRMFPDGLPRGGYSVDRAGRAFDPEVGTTVSTTAIPIPLNSLNM